MVTYRETDFNPARDVDLWTAAHHFMPECPTHAPDLLAVPEPTRVAFAGCWHARIHLVGEAMQAAKAAGARVIVHTGDFLYTSPAANKMLYVTDAWARRLGMWVVVVRGNHDDPALYRKAITSTRRRNKDKHTGQPVVPDGFARLSARVLHAPNGLRWTWHGVEFTALGGAYSVDRPARVEGASYWAGEVASPREVGAVKRGGKTNVLITHDTPAGAHLRLPTPPTWWDVDGAEAHRNLLRTAVDAIEPDWVIGGHMHTRQTTGLWTASGYQTRVEVLDKIENGVPGNLLIADLRDGILAPVEVTLP